MWLQGSSYQSCWWDDFHAQVMSSVLVSLQHSWGCAQSHSIYWYAMSEEPIQTLAKDTSKNQSEWMRREWWSEVTTFPVHLLPLSSKQEKQIHSGLCFQIRQTGIPGVWISIILWWSHVPFIFLNSVCMWMCAYVPKKAQDDLSTCPMSQDSGK